MYEMQLTALSVLADNSGQHPSFVGWENLSYVIEYLCTHVILTETVKGRCFVSTATRVQEQNCFLKVPLVCPSGKSNIWMKMSVVHWWDGTDRRI
jgi:hypothetical protein